MPSKYIHFELKCFNTNVTFFRPFGINITPSPYVPGASIDNHLGYLNFFFIRESSNIREVSTLLALAREWQQRVILWLLSDRRLVYICPTIPKRGSGYSALSRVQPRRQRDHLLLHELLRGQLRPAQEPGPVSGQHGRRRGHRDIPNQIKHKIDKKNPINPIWSCWN